MALSKLNHKSFVDTVEGNPSLIINGDMAVAQRGTVTGVTNGFGGADRYEFSRSGAAAVTLSQDTDVPSNQGFSSSQKVDVTTADTSLATTDYAIVRQIMEAQNLQHLKYGTSEAKKLTLQFWVKSPKTGTHIAELYHYDATYFTSQSYTIATANTWQKVTMTFDGYQTTALDNNNDKGIQVTWWLAAGATYSGGTLSENTWHNTNANRAVGQVNVMDSTSNNFYITGVKLEVGSTATPFQHESYAENLAKCHRYYYKQSPDQAAHFVAFGSGVIYNSTLLLGSLSSPVNMREVPDIGYSGTVSVIAGNATGSVSALVITGDTDLPRHFRIDATSSTSLTVGHGGYVQLNQNGVLDLDAEL